MSPDPTRPASTDRLDETSSAQLSPADQSPRPDPEHFHAALGHVEHQWNSGEIAAGAARGLVYSIVETLGTFVGDPDLPEHVRSGYQGLLESARELRTKIRE